ncbi:unnamed protein product [Cochlearia groenlandica]
MKYFFLIADTSSKAPCLLFISLILIFYGFFISTAQEISGSSKIHIVHMGAKQHDVPELVTKSHYNILEPILGSKEAVEKSIVYSYRHGFSGFAAKLTSSHAKSLSANPEVLSVLPSRVLRLKTTRTFDYLQLLPSSPKGLLHDTRLGSEAIIGIIDSGIWPESKSFNDTGLGPIPKRWKGKCVSGDEFDAKIHCNKKLIGAEFFNEGLADARNGQYDFDAEDEYRSSRDGPAGHGTHVAAIAAGSFVSKVSYNGLAEGDARGAAPHARIAMYKACWGGVGCLTPDVLKAIDHSIRDGVDVISISIGNDVPASFDIDQSDIAFGSFQAVMKGIPVVCAAGNEGPNAQTVGNVAPWIITVAATSMDRSFPIPITLGNNLTILPDIAAPGVNILSATSTAYTFMSGTSMATPVVSGIVGLLRQTRPEWSPAAIRSALVTTAWRTDPSGEPIFSEGSTRKLADPFDYGGGLINPEKVTDPGLVYDLGYNDYAHYLCSADYDDTSISQLLGKPHKCPSPRPSMLDFNMPSITIPSLTEEVTVSRTVTNVGPNNSVYKSVVETPFGIELEVNPKTLVFGSNKTNIKFSVRVKTNHKVNSDYYFGSLCWTDGVHNVTIPVSVRTKLLRKYV